MGGTNGTNGITIVGGTFAEIGDVYKKFLLTREPYCGKPVDEAWYEYKYRNIDKQYYNVRIFLAMDGIEVVGRLCACLEWNGDGFIKGLYVNDEHRGYGIGTQLTERARQWFEKQHCNKILLDVLIDNEYAIKFYERLGFHIHGYAMSFDVSK